MCITLTTSITVSARNLLNTTNTKVKYFTVVIPCRWSETKTWLLLIENPSLIPLDVTESDGQAMLGGFSRNQNFSRKFLKKLYLIISGVNKVRNLFFEGAILLAHSKSAVFDEAFTHCLPYIFEGVPTTAQPGQLPPMKTTHWKISHSP